MPLTRGELELAIAGNGPAVEKTVTFTGAAGLGAVGTVSLFTVTGEVLVKLFAVCTTNVAGATATIAVSTAGGSATLIASTTATNLAAGEIYHDATPDAQVELSSVLTEKVIVNGAAIIATVGTAAITGGVLKFICVWKPLSANGNVVAA